MIQGNRGIHPDGTVVDYRSPHMRMVLGRYAQYRETVKTPSLDSVEAFLNDTLDALARELGFYTHVNGIVVRRVELTGTMEEPQIHYHS